MVCHRVQPGTPAISYKLIATTLIMKSSIGMVLLPGKISSQGSGNHAFFSTPQKTRTRGMQDRKGVGSGYLAPCPIPTYQVVFKSLPTQWVGRFTLHGSRTGRQQGSKAIRR